MKKIISVLMSVLIMCSMSGCVKLPFSEKINDIVGNKTENNVQIGSCVVLGTYEQDNNYMNGQEPLEWYVVAQENDEVLLLSKYVIDYLPYNDVDENVTWEDSSLRQWLNSEFKTIAFQNGEEEGICTVTNINNDNVEENTSGGNDTIDDVFLLSADECGYYLTNDEIESGVSTAWVINKAKEYNPRAKNASCWWLRTPGLSHNRAMYVYDDPAMSYSGNNVSGPFGVRPALWLKTEWLNNSSAVENTNEAVKNDFSSVEIGGTLLFGKYEQDRDESNGSEDIEWIVLAKEGEMSFVISKYCLDGKAFNDEYADVRWENSSLRRWLNNDFYNTAFDSSEQAKIVTRTVPSGVNSDYPHIYAGNDTEDKVFLISIDAANLYFKTNEERMTNGTDYALMEKDVDEHNGGCYWWLRTQGGYDQAAAYVQTNGEINTNGSGVDHGVKGQTYGIRPAMWIAG